MSASAIMMLIVAILIIWGGLALAILNLRRSPEVADEEQDEIAAIE